MPIIDILIAVAILISVVVGIFRGFVKEAISIAALLVAIWAALYFGPALGSISDAWLSSEELQKWFGRVLVFIVVPENRYFLVGLDGVSQSRDALRVAVALSFVPDETCPSSEARDLRRGGQPAGLAPARCHPGRLHGH